LWPRILKSRGRLTRFNPWRGCTKVSPGCAHCYAERDSKRNPGVLGVWGPQGTRVVASEAQWRLPPKWDREARAAGVRRRVFCASLADVFEGPETMPEEAWPRVRAARVRLFHLVSETPNLDWLLLTKRPENVRRFCGAADRSWSESMPPNAFLGTSVEDQSRTNRIEELLRFPAAGYFLSVEPMLGPVDVRAWLPNPRSNGTLAGYWHEMDPDTPRVRWVICGGESGHDARPVDPAWVRALRDQCVSRHVPFHFKQWGEFVPDADVFQPGPGDLSHSTRRDLPRSIPLTVVGSTEMARVGKKAAGRLLDGRTWDEFPKPRTGG
jgi:protein gp37